MTEPLAIIRKSNLRLNGDCKDIAELTEKISEASLIGEIAKSPLMKAKAKRYVDLWLVWKNESAPIMLRNSCAEEINQILEIYSQGRKAPALLVAIRKEQSSRDPSLWKFFPLEEQLQLELGRPAKQIADIYAAAANRNAAEEKKWSLEEEKESLEEAARLHGWDVTRMRRCEHCHGWFEAKRSDARFCKAKCRVENWQQSKRLGLSYDKNMKSWQEEDELSTARS